MAYVETNFRIVQYKLRAAAPLIHKALIRDLRTYAKAIAQQARTNASWSQQIPGSIGTSVGLKGANIKVKGVLGPLYERGSRDNPGTIRHPLFGNTAYWYEQKTRPFVEPARKAAEATIVPKMERAIQAAARAAGF